MTAKKVSEKQVKQYVKQVLDRVEAFYFMPSMGMYGGAGVPDFVVCLNGVFISIETKAGRNKPTQLQNLAMSKVRAAKGITLVVNDSNMGELEPLLVCIKTLSNLDTASVVAGKVYELADSGGVVWIEDVAWK